MLSSPLSAQQKSQRIPFIRQHMYFANLVLLWSITVVINPPPLLTLTVNMNMVTILTKDP